jgi:hypothetical protein
MIFIQLNEKNIEPWSLHLAYVRFNLYKNRDITIWQLGLHTEWITTKGEAKDTEAEARESAAEAAILCLEMVCSVYLIDITYNKTC